MNINTFIFTHKGNKSMKCKDVYKIVSYDNCYVIGLADGVSSQEYSDTGAITVLENIGKMLAREEVLVELSGEEIKFKIV